MIPSFRYHDAHFAGKRSRRSVLAAALMMVSTPGAWSQDSGPGLLVESKPVAVAIDLSPSGALEIAAGGKPMVLDCRAYLASRRPGETEWSEETVPYTRKDSADGKLVLEARFAVATATVLMERQAPGNWKLSGTLKSTSDQPMEVARFHYLDGRTTDPAPNLLSMRHYELPGRIIRPTEELKAPLKSNWGWQRLEDPIHRLPDTGISGDSGILGTDWNQPGLFLGFTGPGSAFGEIGIRTRQKATPFFLAVLLDAIRLDPGKERVLESAWIAYGDPQDELHRWLLACRDLLGPARVRPPLAGYCSWYQVGQGVKPADIRRAIDGFSRFEAPPGGQTIQIDDGFQVMPGDWSGRGEWKSELDKFPAEIRAKGMIPGIWVAPTAIHESHPIVKEHPDWLQRDAKGEFCIVFHNWKTFNGMTNGKTYFLEPDHPGARQFMLGMLRDLRAKGWDYFKIDFAYTVSSHRAKYDPAKTTYESLRDQWQLFRDALGEDALINSCNGGMWRYTIGKADVSRVGGDIGGSMGHIRRNLAEMMLRAHANGIWFQCDPDVFYMREEKSSLNFAQSHLLTATQGLLGTAFLTSDFADQWSPDATRVVKTYWNQRAPVRPAAQRLLLRDDGLPAGLAIARAPGEFTLGIYNWSTAAGDVTLSLDALRLPAGPFTLSSGDGINGDFQIEGRHLTVRNQAPESLRVLHLQAPKHP